MKLEFESSAAQPFAVTDYSTAGHRESDAETVSQMLEAGIKAAQNGDRSEARQLLLQVTEAEPENETAWLWMASISEYPEELIIFLTNVLSLNPNNARAVEWMQATKSLLAETFVKRGEEAMEDPNKDFARQCFLQAIAHDSHCEAAWQALTDIADSVEEKISHLQKISNLNPDNEAARNSLQTLKKQATEQILQTANRAAISGDKEAARAMLDEVLQTAPELEEAWILKAYLAESFSEKVTAFERVLTLNPENDMATAGLASLRATMAKTEARKAEQFALIADFDRKTAEEKASLEDNRPTANLEYPSNFVSSEFYENTRESAMNPPDETADFPAYQTSDEENRAETNPAKSSAETAACPFCKFDNAPDAVFCGFCRTILTLSDLEMFFTRVEPADTELLRQTVERMEAEKTVRPFSARELKNLAVGQINLKNFRQGAANLQKAAQMNPNDSALAAQVDSLKIRLAEIEQRESAPQRATTGVKILIVDDSATIRKLISDRVQECGHEAVCASDGLEALGKIKEFTPDLVLLDIMMPQLDGFQVCKFIRSNEATKNVPIVMISGKDGFFDKVRGRMAGTSGYITKPFGPETLMKTIESYIPRRQEAS